MIDPVQSAATITSGPEVPVPLSSYSVGTTFQGHGANMAAVTTALCAETQKSTTW